MEWFHRMNAEALLFSAQCTALDGKCSISCDSEVTILHTTGKKVQLQAFNFTPFLLTFYFTWSSWQDINCYLIDNNGFILVTEEQSQVMTSEEQEKNFPQAINERLQVITLGLSSFSFTFQCILLSVRSCCCKCQNTCIFPLLPVWLNRLFVVCCICEVTSLSDRALLRRGGARCYEQTSPDGLF